MLLIPDHFTPIQKCIVKAYSEHRSVPLAAVATFHKRNSSYVREVIREYRKFLHDYDQRLYNAALIAQQQGEAVTVVVLSSLPSPDEPENPEAAYSG